MATDRYYFFPTLSSFVQGVILFLTITLGFFQILETLEQTYIFNTFLFCAAVNTVQFCPDTWNIGIFNVVQKLREKAAILHKYISRPSIR